MEAAGRRWSYTLLGWPYQIWLELFNLCYEINENNYRLLEYPSGSDVMNEYQIIIDIFNIIKLEFKKLWKR